MAFGSPDSLIINPKVYAYNYLYLLNLVAPGQILHARESLLGCRLTRSWQCFLLAVKKDYHDK
jgi:hypothetical protein